MNNKFIWIGGGVLVTVAFLGWLFWASTRPLPGEKLPDLGREHIEVGKEATYNSNPPTSGPHYVDWIRAGIYEDVKDDRNLVHSLEHGYVIMSYNCSHKVTGYRLEIIEASAHGLDEEATDSGDSTESGQLSDEFRSDECHSLVDQLISIYDKKGQKKLVIVPRPNLDSRIALTAWNYLD